MNHISPPAVKAFDPLPNTQARFPHKADTVTAETLARLLIGQALSQQDATRLMSTTRLSGIIYELRHKYGWQIEAREESSPTKDGRTAHYARYYLADRELHRLSKDSRSEYAADVFAARRALREGKA